MCEPISFQGSMYSSDSFSAPQLDMDLSTAINRFDRIVGSLGEVKLYTHGSVDAEGYLIAPAFWMTDKGLAIYFAILPPSEDLHEYHDGPKPEDYDTEDKLITVTFAEAIRICWLDQCLFMLQSRRDSTIIWDAQRLWQHFEAIMQMRRGWAPIHENELRLHQNAVELSLVNACIAFRRLATGKDFKASNGSGTELSRI